MIINIMTKNKEEIFMSCGSCGGKKKGKKK